ncbi:TPA: morphogenetic protein [Klebsiella pneumoniae]|uniref:morphogenetic protein n=1 Tax=Klebsiella pneumoniae TaxID=573 RepID=UPI000DE664AA|nr:morphogenetic protein [Klebsiella pneumoniae]SSG63258.1 morphogenetic protein [Klebsiella pneumoniae]HBQ8417721.1 morphogenetic protein [Klebsiella pneumoniae]HBQ8485338.1 morphogenetic protein [Klebsiella pneumoniae]HBQ8505866.1 morphogenetic protein [Klebsiella pneumoniae]HBQ8559418.1 morphogenetic protein [Klebsiella pneumoniae]
MTERGMIFNAEMVRAILAGRKTQTRRIMKVQPESNQLGLLLITDSTRHSDIGRYHWAESNATGNYVRSKLFACPFGAVGDQIWVRETFQGPLFNYEQMDEYLEDSSKFEKPEFCQYAADGGHRPEYQDADDNLRHGWRPSIHMPRWASRILLEITDVRVERLNAISEEDARAEGIIDGGCLNCGEPEPCGCANPEPDATDAFAYLWQSIYGQESWNANPWVWVIEFKRVEGGEA